TRLSNYPIGSVQLDRDQLGDAWLFHGDAVKAIGDFHCLAIVRDQDELRVLLHATQHLDESTDIRVVERGIDLVEQAERAWLVLEQAEHQRDGRERLLPTRQQLHALQAFARRLRDDLDAAFKRVVLVEQRQPGATTAKQGAESLLKVVIDCRERIRK